MSISTKEQGSAFRAHQMRTCGQCGWVHFGITRKDAEAEVARFNAFYDASSPEAQSHYSGRSSMGNYDKCFRCGAPAICMQPYRQGDCPEGCTIGPILIL